MNKYQVYITTNKLNNKYYIGMHKGDIFEDSYYGSGRLIKKSLKKYGKENFDRQVVSDNLTKLQARWLERALVGESAVNDNNCYNLIYGGLYNDGNVGENNNFYGRTHSKETKAKISKSRKGKCLGSENHFYGKKHSLKTRKKLKEINTGKTQTPELIERRMSSIRKPVIQFDVDGKYINEFDSVKRAVEETSTSKSAINRCLKGRTESVKGYVWKYKEEIMK